MAFRHIDPTRMTGLCAVCLGTAMMPRSAPEHVRVPCDACHGSGAVA